MSAFCRALRWSLLMAPTSSQKASTFFINTALMIERAFTFTAKLRPELQSSESRYTCVRSLKNQFPLKTQSFKEHGKLKTHCEEICYPQTVIPNLEANLQSLNSALSLQNPLAEMELPKIIFCLQIENHRIQLLPFQRKLLCDHTPTEKLCLVKPSSSQSCGTVLIW